MAVRPSGIHDGRGIRAVGVLLLVADIAAALPVPCNFTLLVPLW